MSLPFVAGIFLCWCVYTFFDAVNYWAYLRMQGFKIKEVVQDRKFAKEYQLAMQKERFKIKDMPQTDVSLTEGFRYLDKSVRNGTLYYCHAEPMEYCAGNVRAVERGTSVVHFEKISETARIDVFDAAVFAVSAYLDDLAKTGKAKGWWDGETESS